MTNAPFKEFRIYLVSGQVLRGYAQQKALSDFKMAWLKPESKLGMAVLTWKESKDTKQLNSLSLFLQDVKAIEVMGINEP